MSMYIYLLDLLPANSLQQAHVCLIRKLNLMTCDTLLVRILNSGKKSRKNPEKIWKGKSASQEIYGNETKLNLIKQGFSLRLACTDSAFIWLYASGFSTHANMSLFFSLFKLPFTDSFVVGYTF